MYMYIYKDYKINTLKIIFKNSMSIIEILENGDFLKIYFIEVYLIYNVALISN